MPPRSPKMKRRILGFQRRVWWPKWTPASSSSLIPTWAMVFSLSFVLPPDAGDSTGSAEQGPERGPGREVARISLLVQCRAQVFGRAVRLTGCRWVVSPTGRSRLRAGSASFPTSGGGIGWRIPSERAEGGLDGPPPVVRHGAARLRGRRAAPSRRRSRSPVTGWSKASRAACRNWRSQPEPPGGARTRGRRPRDGRSPPGGRGSGACARSQPHAQQRGGAVAELALDREVGSGRRAGASVSVDIRVRIAPVAADGGVDRARCAPAGGRRRGRGTRARSRVAPCAALQRGVHVLGAGDDEQARRVAVQAVHDARRAPGPGRRRRGRPERCDERGRAVPAAPGWTTTPAGLSTTSRRSSS